MMEDPVTIEQVAICVDRFATSFKMTVEADEYEIFLSVVRGFPAAAVLGCVDELLMTSKWYPRPKDFRDAAVAQMRRLADEQAKATVSTSCGFCRGYLWGYTRPVVLNGQTYEVVEPCNECAPLLFGAVLDLQARAKVARQRGASAVNRDTEFSYNVKAKLDLAHIAAIDGGGRFDKMMKERRKAAHESRRSS